ncbi:MAG: metalloregulator ArsR/SmtB family transcription factor [Pseudomonadota bacterium]
MDQLLIALKAAGEPTRLRLLALCAHMDLTVTQLTKILGQSQPRVSRHLKLLNEAGLLERFREGSWIFYRLASHGLGAELGRTLVDALPEQDEVLALDFKRLEAIQKERAKLAKAYFKRNAGQWHKIRALHVDEAQVEARLIELLSGDAVADLLDIGTGTGRLLELFGPRVEQAVGIDLSREMLTVARANLEKAGLRNCKVREGNMYQLPLADRSFDAVTLHQVLHYADEPERAIAEAARVLRPEGRLVLIDFTKHELDELRAKHHHRWLGFGDRDVAGWFARAGLTPEAPIALPGDPLTVNLWSARKPRGRALH